MSFFPSRLLHYTIARAILTFPDPLVKTVLSAAARREQPVVRWLPAEIGSLQGVGGRCYEDHMEGAAGIIPGLATLGRELARHSYTVEFEGAVPTARRLLNIYRLCWEWSRMKTVMRSYPAKLCIESCGACNLSCPDCFTGAGEIGHARGTLALALYRPVLAELGKYLWQIEFHNWGEPLLNKHLTTMIAEATAHGVSTLICTNFSLPFDERRAEALVGSGLKLLGVSIDGARQETYERYRVGGDLERVLRNCRLVADAKRRLGVRTPRVNWVYHVFPHNIDDVPAANALAGELDMDFQASRGRVVGPDWDPKARHMPHEHVEPIPCPCLWHTAVMFTDGSVAPCRGSFYPEDDMGRLAVNGGPGAATFRDLWNGERYRLA